MDESRRKFLKTAGVAGVAVASHDWIANLLAQSPRGRVLESKFKGMADIVLAEAKTAGCSYGDVRFTMSSNIGGGNANFSNNAGRGGRGGDAGGDPAAFAGRGGGGGGRGGGGRGGGGGGGGFGGGRGGGGGIPTDADRQAGGFGVRVIHSGVWGFASSPIVTEDEIRRITRIAVEVAKASAIAKKTDVRLAPVQAYIENYKTPMVKDPTTISAADKQAWAQAIVDKASKVPGVSNVTASVQFGYDWKYFASTEGSYIEQEIYTTSPSLNVSGTVNGVSRSRTYPGAPGTGGFEIAEESDLLAAAERVAGEAVEYCTAKPLGGGIKDLILSPSHTMLTLHEIVAHPTELDRVMGYEANYAGTSFVKLSDLGKLKYGSKLFNVHASKIDRGLGSCGFDDDGVKNGEFDIVKEGILVGLQTNRETAHYVGEKASRGCTFATTWRDYPFLRMPNIHLLPGGPGSPTRADLIKDVKDGVIIDGRGSYSIDQQRYNGQFGGNAFWEIKNGKVTRMVTDVTYNAITTDFWGNLDGITGKDEWVMHGTGGDAKGQPTQTNSISHGCPWSRIRKIQVGAAFA
jgi:TldD protein